MANSEYFSMGVEIQKQGQDWILLDKHQNDDGLKKHKNLRRRRLWTAS